MEINFQYQKNMLQKGNICCIPDGDKWEVISWEYPHQNLFFRLNMQLVYQYNRRWQKTYKFKEFPIGCLQG